MKQSVGNNKKGYRCNRGCLEVLFFLSTLNSKTCNKLGLEIAFVEFNFENMSRGFVKEDDQEEVPLVAPRADLPENVENFVTQNGMDLLLTERESLTSEQENLDNSQEKEYRISFNHINAKLQLLNERITSAKIIDPEKLPQDEIHFGATVTFKNTVNNLKQTFQLVGVDEADIKKQKISFITPLAKVLMHKKVGEKAVLNLGERKNEFEILIIEY